MRCVICDLCPETDETPPVPMEYSQKEQGYVCNNCSSYIDNDLTEDTIPDLVESEVLEEQGLESPTKDNGDV